MLLARNNAQGIDRIDRGHESVARDDAADSRRWPDGKEGESSGTVAQDLDTDTRIG